MNKVLVGAATAAVWFSMSYAAHAERVCNKVCDHGSCISKCVDHPDSGVVIHEHERRPDVDVRTPGIGVEIGH